MYMRVKAKIVYICELTNALVSNTIVTETRKKDAQYLKGYFSLDCDEFMRREKQRMTNPVTGHPLGDFSNTQRVHAHTKLGSCV